MGRKRIEDEKEKRQREEESVEEKEIQERLSYPQTLDAGCWVREA